MSDAQAAYEVLPDGAITSVPGFRAAGIAAGIKKRGGLDVALIVSDQPCTAAAVYTQNQIQSPAVVFDRALIERNPQGVQAVVINSGCANAVTGEQGHQNAIATAQAVIDALGLPPDSAAVMSTGVIGVQLPMDKLLPGVQSAAAQLQNTIQSGHDAARAIMTTDTRPKEIAIRTTIDGVPITIAGMCKGAGMIHPNMATLLALVCTDAAIDPEPLREALRYAADRSFNCMTIDGDSSTNDTLLCLASGSAGRTENQEPRTGDEGSEGAKEQGSNNSFPNTQHPTPNTWNLEPGTRNFVQFRDALTAVCIELAKMVARDGEGATKFVTIDIMGARSFEEARQIGRTIATSPLFKTAIFGTDANWGRVLMAAGRAGVTLDPDRLALWFGDVQLLGNGAPLPYAEADAHAALLGSDVEVRLDLGLGDERATVWTCDFSHEYVSINADYRT